MIEKTTLYLIATPIGHLEDITLRVLRILKHLPVIACEDTRVTRKIFQKYDIPLPRVFFSYHEHNEQAASQRILAHLHQGESVGLCTDAGSPSISDPGYRLVQQALEAGIAVDALPGPSAPTTALVLSGLPTSSYLFRGFPPPKTGKRKTFLQEDALLPHTLIYFISPYKLAAFLKDAFEVLGDRQGAICFELTKVFQRVEHGTLSELIERMEGKVHRGEITLVVAGAHRRWQKDKESL